jgi:hypothetical protein
VLREIEEGVVVGSLVRGRARRLAKIRGAKVKFQETSSGAIRAGRMLMRKGWSHEAL